MKSISWAVLVVFVASCDLAAEVPRVSPRTASPGPNISSPENLMNDPRASALALYLKRAELEVSYGPFFAEEKLSANERIKFVEAIAPHELEREAARNWFRGRGASADETKAAAAREREAGVQLRAAKFTVLGAEAFARLQTYDRTRSVRDLSVSRFAGGAALIDAAVTARQAEQLLEAMAMTSASYRAGGKLELAEVDWTSVDEQSGTFLSEKQRELLTKTDLSLRWSSESMRRPALVAAEAMQRGALIPGQVAGLASPESRRAVIAGENFRFYVELRLKPAEVAEFERILLEQKPAGPSRGTDDRAQKLLKLLGRAGYEKYLSGEFGLAGSPAAQVAGMLYFTPAPLTAEQGRRFARVLTEERAKAKMAKSPRSPREQWAVVSERSREFLGEEQLGALRVLQLREELQAARQEAQKYRAAGDSKK